MPLSEFDIIQQYFAQQPLRRTDVTLGIGDDAALIHPLPDQEMVVAIDTLVEGVHFPPATDAYDVGWKALAVNLSDMAAMGAEPAWFTLALTLEQADEKWLAAFSQGLVDLAGRANIQLVGGDTTRGSLTVSIQIAGYVPTAQALLRRGAKPGDEIWVSGSLGDAALGLRIAQGELEPAQDRRQYLLQRLNRPSPRYKLGMALRQIATSCIDISDGLLADLAHLCEKSETGATIQFDAVPLSESLRDVVTTESRYRELPLYGGDDYELCFTAQPDRHQQLLSLGQRLACSLTCIGVMTAEAGIRCQDGDGHNMEMLNEGYQHFGGRS